VAAVADRRCRFPDPGAANLDPGRRHRSKRPRRHVGGGGDGIRRHVVRADLDRQPLGFLLSMAATFGVVVAVFQWGWLSGLFGVEQTGPVFSMLPILLVVVFGLAMDYQIFLVTWMREEHVHGAAPTPAVVTGFAHGVRVVTAAATIMASVFAGFILSEQSLVKSIGLALAAAVLFDAFIVRMTIVPAVMTLLGRHAWWLPDWLQRLLPNLDIEGQKLTHRLEEAPTPTPPLSLTH
jgi:putative drug exporter of the RND superfamily